MAHIHDLQGKKKTAHIHIRAHLFKVTQRYVTPYISIKVDQNIIEPVYCIKQFSHIVMSFNL